MADMGWTRHIEGEERAADIAVGLSELIDRYAERFQLSEEQVIELLQQELNYRLERKHG